MEKRCSKCGKILPLTMFTKNSKTKDGLQTHCKECQKIYDQRAKERRLAKKQALSNFEFTPRQILEELKKRGISWNKMYAPIQKIYYKEI